MGAGGDETATIADVGALLGVSRKRADTISRRDTFPAPLLTSRSGRVWRRADIEDWVRQYRPERAAELGL